MKKRFSPSKKKIISIITVFVLFILLTGCKNSKPIQIGLAIELTGSRAVIGVAARNGATLAVDQINEAGGINGRPINLLIRDDKGDPGTARQVDAELVDEGVVAIIGHITSQQTLAVFEQMNQAKTILISPTTSSPDFDKQDDYFFRVMQTNTDFGIALGDYIYQQGIRKLAGVYDITNRSFSETLWNATRDEFIALGGEAVVEVEFSSPEAATPQAVAELIADYDTEAMMIIASDVDTALIVQYLSIAGIDAKIFGSSWAATDELLQKGGSAIEGMVLTALINDQDTSPNYLEFRNAYIERFGIDPGLGASHAYETVYILAEALKQTNGQKEGLQEALLAISNFQGVNGTITFDKYGDVHRDSYMVQVQDHQFVIIASIRVDVVE